MFSDCETVSIIIVWCVVMYICFDMIDRIDFFFLLSRLNCAKRWRKFLCFRLSTLNFTVPQVYNKLFILGMCIMLSVIVFCMHSSLWWLWQRIYLRRCWLLVHIKIIEVWYQHAYSDMFPCNLVSRCGLLTSAVRTVITVLLLRNNVAYLPLNIVAKGYSMA